MTMSAHPTAPHHLPAFITAPGETDVLMVGVAVFLVVAVLMIGILFLRIHSLPERMAHKGHKLQFEIVAVLGLLALFTHIHLFWVAGLLLALIDIPDFSGSFTRMAGALEEIAAKPAVGAAAATKDAIPAIMSDGEPVETPTVMGGTKPGNGVAELPSRPKLAPVTGRS
jgi:hypothetical protein